MCNLLQKLTSDNQIYMNILVQQQQQQQQQQHSLFSQASWSRLEMKPERNTSEKG